MATRLRTSLPSHATRVPLAPRAMRVAAGAARPTPDDVVQLNPVLSAVNSATMYIASNDTLNRLKSGVWGLFAGEEGGSGWWWRVCVSTQALPHTRALPIPHISPHTQAPTMKTLSPASWSR